MDLKGRTPSDITHVNSRLRVWYEEDGERTCYTGTVTQCEPQGSGLRVWFDGSRANEQQWVEDEDEWEWMEQAPMSSAEAALRLTAVRLHIGGFGAGSEGLSLFARLDGTSPASPPMRKPVKSKDEMEMDEVKPMDEAPPTHASDNAARSGRVPRQSAAGSQKAVTATVANAQPPRAGKRKAAGGSAEKPPAAAVAAAAAAPADVDAPAPKKSRSGRRKTAAEKAAIAAAAAAAAAAFGGDYACAARRHHRCRLHQMHAARLRHPLCAVRPSHVPPSQGSVACACHRRALTASTVPACQVCAS